MTEESILATSCSCGLLLGETLTECKSIIISHSSLHPDYDQSTADGECVSSTNYDSCQGKRRSRVWANFVLRWRSPLLMWRINLSSATCYESFQIFTACQEISSHVRCRAVCSDRDRRPKDSEVSVFDRGGGITQLSGATHFSGGKPEV